jgi:hypothetical protein
MILPEKNRYAKGGRRFHGRARSWQTNPTTLLSIFQADVPSWKSGLSSGLSSILLEASGRLFLFPGMNSDPCLSLCIGIYGN